MQIPMNKKGLSKLRLNNKIPDSFHYRVDFTTRPIMENLFLILSTKTINIEGLF